MDWFGPMRKVLARCERGEAGQGSVTSTGAGVKTGEAAARRRQGLVCTEPRQPKSQPSRNVDVCG